MASRISAFIVAKICFLSSLFSFCKLVTDGNTTGNDFTYDANGNMITDANKGIININYNHLNLPSQVTFAADKYIDYIYDASGIKLKKIVTDQTAITETSYAGNFIYEETGGVEELKFFNQPEGYVEPEDAADYTQGFSYIYQYKDHLGNIRLSYTDANGDGDIDVTTDPNTNEIVEENNYYPFGLKHKGYNNNQGAYRDHKFEYNGVEMEESLGLNLMEMDFRQYDATIARFTSIDPLTHHTVSPYQAFDNNPIYWADPSGADSESSNWILDLFNNTPNDGLVYNYNLETYETTTSTPDEHAETSDNKKDENSNEANSSFPLWPFPGAYFGQIRHLMGPDAIAVNFDVDVVVVGGVVISPIGAILILKGPEKGSIEYIYDIGIAAGLDISASGKITELYFNGKTNDISKGTFQGFRIEAEIGVTLCGVDFGRGISWGLPSQGFIQNAVFGLSTSIGVGVPAPILLNGNLSAGYTGYYSDLIKNLKGK